MEEVEVKKDESNSTWTPEKYEKLKVEWNGQKTSEAEAERLNDVLGRTMGKYSWDSRIKKAVGPELYKSTIERNKNPNPKQPDLPNTKKPEKVEEQESLTKVEGYFNKVIEISFPVEGVPLPPGECPYRERYILIDEYKKLQAENASLQKKLKGLEAIDKYMKSINLKG